MLPIFLVAHPASASSKAVLKSRIDGTWAIYCSDERKNPDVRDCSAVAGSVALDSSGDWVRLAFTLTSASGDTEFTIRTPRITILRDGIGISADSQPIGRVFFDECDKFCSATVPLNGHLLAGFLAADSAGFEYSISRDQGRVITVDFGPFGKAMSELRRAVGLSDPAPKEENRYLLQVKVPDETRPPTETWGLSTPDCAVPLGLKEIKLSATRKISQEQELSTWLSKAKACPGNPVLVIKSKDPTERSIGQSDFYNGRITNEKLNLDAVYGFVKYKGPKDVFFDCEDGQPPIRLNQ
jgi:invasion protein IalB